MKIEKMKKIAYLLTFLFCISITKSFATYVDNDYTFPGDLPPPDDLLEGTDARSHVFTINGDLRNVDIELGPEGDTVNINAGGIIRDLVAGEGSDIINLANGQVNFIDLGSNGTKNDQLTLSGNSIIVTDLLLAEGELHKVKIKDFSLITSNVLIEENSVKNNIELFDNSRIGENIQIDSIENTINLSNNASINEKMIIRANANKNIIKLFDNSFINEDIDIDSAENTINLSNNARVVRDVIVRVNANKNIIKLFDNSFIGRDIDISSPESIISLSNNARVNNNVNFFGNANKSIIELFNDSRIGQDINIFSTESTVSLSNNSRVVRDINVKANANNNTINLFNNSRVDGKIEFEADANNNTINLLNDSRVNEIEVDAVGTVVNIKDNAFVTKILGGQDSATNLKISGGTIGTGVGSEAVKFAASQNNNNIQILGGKVDGIIEGGLGTDTFVISGGIITGNLFLSTNGSVFEMTGGNLNGNIDIRRVNNRRRNKFDISGGIIGGDLRTGDFGDDVNFSGGIIRGNLESWSKDNASIINISNNAILEGNLVLGGGPVDPIVGPSYTRGDILNLTGGTIKGNIISHSTSTSRLDIKGGVVNGYVQLGNFDDEIDIYGGLIKGEIRGGVNSVDTLRIKSNYSSSNNIRNIHNISIEPPINSSAQRVFTLNNAVIGNRNFYVEDLTRLVMNNNSSIESNNFVNAGTVYVKEGTRVINGNYTQTSKGVLLFDVVNNNATAKLSVQGQANLGNSKVALNIDDINILKDNSNLNILESNNAILENNVSIIDPNGVDLNSAILKFIPKVINNKLQVNIKRQSFSEFDQASSVAEVFDKIAIKGEMKDVLDILARTKDPQELKKFFKQSDTEDNQGVVTLSSFDGPNRIIHARLDDVMAAHSLDGVTAFHCNSLNFANTGSQWEQKFGVKKTNYSNDLFKDNDIDFFKIKHMRKNLKNSVLYAKDPIFQSAESIWLQFFGNNAKQKTHNNLNGFRANALGFALGADGKIRKNLLLGTNVSYAKSRVKSIDVLRNTLDIKSYQLSVYSMYYKNNKFLEGIINYAHNKYDSVRNIDSAGIDRIALADYDGNQYGCKLRFGYNIKKYKSQITPLASVEYSLLNIGRYNERNANSLNLKNVKYSKIHSLTGGVGFNASFTEIAESDIFVPKLRFMIKHDINVKKASVAANFEGSSLEFRNDLAKPDKTKIDFGAGFTAKCKNKISLVALYNFEYRAHSYGHYGYLKLKYSF